MAAILPRITVLALLTGSVLSLVACNEGTAPAPAATGALPDRVTVRIGEATFEAEVSETRAERSLGLGERDSLARNAGMLFVFREEGEHSFWMKGMRFPLDFVWISADRRVVALTENVPPPEPGTPNDELDLFDENVQTQYVLELNAGVIEDSGIELGGAVAFEPDISPGLAE